MDIPGRLLALDGTVSYYYRALDGGEAVAHNLDAPHNAASLIKLPIMAEAMRQFESGEAARDEVVLVRDEDRVPPCGVLTFMHEGLEIQLIDLVWLMVSLSDNMAANLLMDRLTLPAIRRGMEGLQMTGCKLNRKLFAKGPGNVITGRDICALFERLYAGELVSEDASREMLDMLSGQQLQNKIPMWLPLDMHIAHKTGEDIGVSHDVGIVYAKRPFLVGFFGTGIDAPAFNRAAQDISYERYLEHGGV
ncbi:MAG TPA: serine hydrolase [Terriglobales bacterium]|nr:serine hydrolase [Terriglobales bacterium]